MGKKDTKSKSKDKAPKVNKDGLTAEQEARVAKARAAAEKITAEREAAEKAAAESVAAGAKLALEGGEVKLKGKAAKKEAKRLAAEAAAAALKPKKASKRAEVVAAEAAEEQAAEVVAPDPEPEVEKPAKGKKAKKDKAVEAVAEAEAASPIPGLTGSISIEGVSNRNAIKKLVGPAYLKANQTGKPVEFECPKHFSTKNYGDTIIAPYQELGMDITVNEGKFADATDTQKDGWVYTFVVSPDQS